MEENETKEVKGKLLNGKAPLSEGTKITLVAEY